VSHQPQRVIVDCDPGIDDAAALLLAATSPKIELVGVTSVAGNVDLDLTTRNALALLELYGREDVPVAAGASRGLVRPKPDHAAVHGMNGLGGVQLDPPARQPVGEHAVDFVARRLIDEPPGTLTLAAIGPLTNVALLFGMHPHLTSRISSLLVMGCGDAVGNVTRDAEYNTWADPEAAQRVLTEPELDIRIVEYGVTRRATVDPADLAAQSGVGATLAAMLEEYETYLPPDRRAIHDALAFATLLDPDIVEWRPTRVAVDTGDGVTRGKSTFTPDPGSSVHVSVDVDVERFRAILLDRVAAAG
jgi:pyrimidine-specific ribonucleoside hydrolase